MSVKFGSQAVGLITVLAISGSVVLLSLGKQKLALLKNYVFEPAEQEDRSSDSGLEILTAFCGARSSENGSKVGVQCASDLPKEGKARMEACFSQEPANESKDCNSRELTLSEDGVCCSPRVSSMAESSPRISSMVESSPRISSVACPLTAVSGLPCSTASEIMSMPADSAHGSDAPSDSGSSKLVPPLVKKTKKVRFSADVAEPAGNNQEYRRRIKSRKATDARGPKSSKSTNDEKICALHKADDNSRSFLPGSYGQSGQASSSFTNQERKVLKSVAQPNLPANRLALYKGIYQYRSQHRYI